MQRSNLRTPDRPPPPRRAGAGRARRAGVAAVAARRRRGGFAQCTDIVGRRRGRGGRRAALAARAGIAVGLAIAVTARRPRRRCPWH